MLLATPTVLYEVVAYVVPGLTKSEKDLLAPIVFGSSILFYIGWVAWELTPWGSGDFHSIIIPGVLAGQSGASATDDKYGDDAPAVMAPALAQDTPAPPGSVLPAHAVHEGWFPAPHRALATHSLQRPEPGVSVHPPRRLLFSYEVLTPAALNFFVTYADGAVESLWSIDQYFEFVLVLMLSTGLAFQARGLPCCICFRPLPTMHRGSSACGVEGIMDPHARLFGAAWMRAGGRVWYRICQHPLALHAPHLR